MVAFATKIPRISGPSLLAKFYQTMLTFLSRIHIMLVGVMKTSKHSGWVKFKFPGRFTNWNLDWNSQTAVKDGRVGC